MVGERAELNGTDPRANTNDVWLHKVENAYVNRIIRKTDIVAFWISAAPMAFLLHDRLN
jgi:hypothetical protein